MLRNLSLPWRKGLLAASAALLVTGLGVAGTHLASAATAPAASAAQAATAGCGKAPTLTSGSRTIQSNGKNRSFILRVPANYNQNRQYRVFFGFHWNGGSGNDVDSGGTSGYPWSYYGQRAKMSDSAIFVAPNGLNAGWANSGGEDVTFVDNMLALISNGLCVDTSQVFALGFSYGGGMSYALACARPTVFRAVTVYSGGQISGCSGGNSPVAYLGVHGLRDPVVNISAGRSLRDRFVRNNGCTAQSPREPAQGSLSHTITYYSGCRAGYPVVWAAFDAGHNPGPWDGSLSDFNPGERSWTVPLVYDFFNQFNGTTTPPSSPGPTASSPGPTPSSPGPTTSSPGPSPSSTTAGACRVTAKVNAWNSGLTEDITVTNTGTGALNGWSLTFTLPGGQSITSGWNATYSPASGQVTARNAAYNGSVAPGASVSFGFQAAHTGNTAAATGFSLNGASCAIA